MEDFYNYTVFNKVFLHWVEGWIILITKTPDILF